ncbi:MAG TPA: hypothetical protein VE035_09995 [Puia sp.]|nr:hypothetical protein [Puia sp.]
MNRTILFICLFSFSSVRLLAQGNNSPYSLLGVGDLEDNYYNRTAGLANTGVAYRSSRFLISNNPASYSALENQFFAVEMGIRGSLVNYYGQPVSTTDHQSGDITFRRLALGIKASKHWGTSIGLVPFSTQNYEFNFPTYLDGGRNEIANSYYQGHGGINKVYWSNAYEFFKHLSVGVEASYLFGSLTQKEILQNFASGSTLASTTRAINLSNLYMNYGLQYFGKLGKKWNYSVGATFANQSDLYAVSSLVAMGPDSTVLRSQELSQSYFTLPNTYGVGISLTRNQKYTFLADYKHQAFSDQHYETTNYSLQNSDKVSVGFELSKNQVFYNTKVEKSYFQAGLYYGSSYLQVAGKQILDRGVTVGFGINSLKLQNPLNYSIVLQYGIKGTQVNQLVEQRYFNVTFSVNYRDIWYTKGRKYD